MNGRFVRRRRWCAITAATVLSSAGLFASVSVSAQAATTLGQTGPVGLCNGGYGQVQDPGGSPPGYTVPVDGVITSFSAASDLAATPVRLLILKPPVSGTTYTLVAKSEQVYFSAPGVQTFPTSISVQAGEVIGDWGYICGTPTSNPADHFHSFNAGDPALGPRDFPTANPPDNRANLSATLEPTPAAPAATGPTGERAAALKKCKKKHSAKARKKCKRKARRLPV
jgi:hypothetical protein